jgi:hypothetical protein
MFSERVSALGQAEPVAKLNVDVASTMLARQSMRKTVSPRRAAQARDRTSKLDLVSHTLYTIVAVVAIASSEISEVARL